ncbi:calcium ATPase [Fragilariopsis cylindrus CCMP1102]|uniref:Calcium-transporting ATPase n=1 Tax=Fragilariopsis cylindrus CCMP1102 TaxID=635003 RepID=A0A1E7F1P4_9STRA|nr:calcium ATPase [Fragilariopsis cylindrus CCMP1102]|eukprot:OEU12112.1 calcium ATPase [Fragilariopsis cylindrus CCMP1102]
MVSSNTLPYQVTVEEVLKNHGHTDLKSGLSTDRVHALRATYGSNELEKEERTPLWKLVLEQFDDKLVQILLFAALLSFVLAFFEDIEGGHWIEAFVEPAVILLILIINAIVGVWQESNAENALEALKKMQSLHTPCLRGGIWYDQLPTEELVPGDIVKISVGDRSPADCRLVSFITATLRADEGALTGESETVLKQLEPTSSNSSNKSSISDQKNMVFAGTTISGGKAIGIVCSIGMKTEIGKIQSAVSEASEEQEKTPLTQKLDEFGDLLTKVITAICVLVWVMNYNKFFDPVFGGIFKGCIYYLKIAVALGVAAIPEGLPAVITLCLALGTKKMVKRNAIVRRLPSVETLGCCTVICSDKTGTLTTNQMVVESIDDYSGNNIREYHITGTEYSPTDGAIQDYNTSADTSNGSSLEMMALVCTLCNEAIIKYKDGQYVRIGEPTEAALKCLVEKMGLPSFTPPSNEVERAEYYGKILKSRYVLEATLEFCRDRKSMSVLCKSIDTNKRTLFVKGAAELLLQRCTTIMRPNGEVVKLTSIERNALAKQITTMSQRPLRVLGMAIKQNMNSKEKLPSELKNINEYEAVESELTFIGLTGIKDPPRPEVRGAIQRCQDAGIRVIMITGDNKVTAEAIARDVGIFTKDDDLKGKSFTGAEFFHGSISDEERARLIMVGGGSRVFSRTEPRDKQLLVKLLRNCDEVPAMTGDGVNDAPALKQASIGIAMGISGTEVAKEASDMILADDNFATIVDAVEEGRSIYSNMKAFIRYMISSNIGEVVSIFLTSSLGVPEGLIPVQLLWVNLVTDGPPATALGFNPPDPDVMLKPPRGKNDALINNWVFFRYMVIGLYVGFATVGIFIFWYIGYEPFVNYLGPDLMNTLGSTYDGHSMVSYAQLTHWGQCRTGSEAVGTIFEGFSVNDFDNTGDGFIEDFTSEPCTYFTKGKMKASTLSLSVLVTIEMFNALNAVSEDGSLLTIPPWVNPYLLLAMASSFIMHFLILYVPAMATVFSISPHNTIDWILVFLFSFPVIILDEILKYIGRRRNESERKERERKTKEKEE